MMTLRAHHAKLCAMNIGQTVLQNPARAAVFTLLAAAGVVLLAIGWHGWMTYGSDIVLTLGAGSLSWCL